MIDDEVLERLLGEAGDAVEVPPGGPAGILAARDQRHRSQPSPAAVAVAGSPRGTGHVRLWAAACAAAVVLVVGVAVARSSGGGPTASRSAAPGPVAVAPVPAPAAKAASGAGSAVRGMLSEGNAGAPLATASPSAPASAAPTVPPAAPPNEVPSLATKVVKTGQVALRVGRGQVTSTVSTLESDAAALGGYVASSTSSTGSGAGSASSQGDVTLRVPVASFDPLVEDARRAGTATSVTTSGQDVTAQFVDLQARIDSLTAARAQYQQILAKATAIGDVLAVESQLSDVQTQIEQLQGQLNVIADQSSYSTLTVQVNESAPPAPLPVAHPVQGGLSRAWSHARSDFTSGIESVVAALGGIAVFAVVAGGLLVLARVVWVVGRRRLI